MRQHKMKLFLDFLMGYKNFNDILFVYQLTAHLIVGKKKQLRNISNTQFKKQINMSE